MGLFRRTEPGMCVICNKRPGVVRIRDGYICGMCVPLNCTFDMPTADEVRSHHIKDPEIVGRIELFKETESFGDLRFDDDHDLFFKGRYPNMTVPILSYGEIAGFRIKIDDENVAFNSVGGGRALMRPISDELIHKAAKEFDSISLEVESGRGNIRFAPYQIWSFRNRIRDSKDDALRDTIRLAQKLDGIVEGNIAREAVR